MGTDRGGDRQGSIQFVSKTSFRLNNKNYYTPRGVWHSAADDETVDYSIVEPPTNEDSSWHLSISLYLPLGWLIQVRVSCGGELRALNLLIIRMADRVAHSALTMHTSSRFLSNSGGTRKGNHMKILNISLVTYCTFAGVLQQNLRQIDILESTPQILYGQQMTSS